MNKNQQTKENPKQNAQLQPQKTTKDTLIRYT